MLAHDGSPTLNIGNVKVDVGMKRGLCTVAVYLDGSITAYRIARLVSPAAPPEDQFTKQWTDYLKANNPGGALQGDFFARCFAAVIFCMESREWSDGVVDVTTRGGRDQIFRRFASDKWVQGWLRARVAHIVHNAMVYGPILPDQARLLFS
ncbi:hypothetical protein ONS96_006442 [Cadophora gregata f. sp. sojae]|nr:hypothetical protein ONS96_006442 [Cadophora gregata f. sp. sojae]